MHSQLGSVAGTLIVSSVVALAWAHDSWSDTIYVASNGDDAAAGTTQAPLRTVQAGLQKGGPGHTVFVKKGVYRERLTFPRDGAAGKPIVLTGEAGAILDGGTMITGWERVAGAGNVHRVAYTGPQPYNLTWNNKYILRIRDEYMPVTQKPGRNNAEYILRSRNESMAPDGMTILREGPAGWDTYEGPPYRSWDGVQAMWGTLNGYLYIGFGDAAIDPARQEITTTPSGGQGGATITIDGRKFITVRGLTVRNGYNAVLVRNKSSDCIIENNTLIGGWHTVEVMSGSSRIVVRKNEMTLGYVHELAPDDPRHYFIWAAFKITSDWDRICVNLSDVGSDNEVAENHLYENFDGVQNQKAALRLTVRNNLIEKMADDGLEPDGEETEARWHDNIVRECNIAYRHKGVIGPGPMYVYRNEFYSKADRTHGEGKGIYFFGGTTTPAYIYQNSFATSLGFSLGSTKVEMGTPNVWVVNNLFSCARICNDSRRWTIKPHFEYNYFGGDLSAPLEWWGKTNKVVANGMLWKVGAETDYQLGATSAAREAGIDLSKPWTLDGIEHPALAGMEAGYFTGTRPDAGARQYHPPAGKTGLVAGGATQAGAASDWLNTAWRYRLTLETAPDPRPRKGVAFEATIDLGEVAAAAGLKDKINGNRLVLTDAVEAPAGPVPCRVTPLEDQPNKIRIAWLAPDVPPNQIRRYHLYFDAASNLPSIPVAGDLPPDNLVANPSFVKWGENGGPVGWKVNQEAAVLRAFASAGKCERLSGEGCLTLRCAARDSAQLRDAALILSQTMSAAAAQGQSVQAGTDIFLEKGLYGCGVNIKLEGVMAGGKSVYALDYRKYLYLQAEGQVVRFRFEGIVRPGTENLVLEIELHPQARYYGIDNTKTVVTDESADVTVHMANVFVRPATRVRFPQWKPANYVPGNVAGAPLNLALSITGWQAFLFNTFPTIRGYGYTPAGEKPHFPMQCGTVELWVRPHWDNDDNREHVVVHAPTGWVCVPNKDSEGGNARSHYFDLRKLGSADKNEFQFVYGDDNGKRHTLRARLPWKKDEWMHLAATWDCAAGRMGLFANGRNAGVISEGKPWPFGAMSEVIQVGNEGLGFREDQTRRCLDGDVDEMRCSDIVRYPEDFTPNANTQFEMDEHTNSLFHFEGDARGVKSTGSGVVPSMTVFPRPYEERYFLLDELQAGQVTRRRIVLPEASEAELATRYEASRCPTHDFRSRLNADRTADPATVECVEKEFTQVIRKNGESCVLHVGGDAPPEPLSVVIEPAEGAGTLLRGPKVLLNDDLDFSTAKTLVDGLCRGLKTPREKAVGIFKYLTEHMPWWPDLAERGQREPEPYRYYTCYGDAICSQQSECIAFLWHTAGLSAMTLGIGHHVVPQVYFDGGWRLMDVTYGMYPLQRDNETIAAVDDLMDDQHLADRELICPMMPDSMRDWAYHFITYPHHTPGYTEPLKLNTLDADLRPGETYVRNYHNHGEWNQLGGAGGSLHPAAYAYYELANGEFRFRPQLTADGLQRDAVSVKGLAVSQGQAGNVLEVSREGSGEIVWEVKSPFPITSGSVRAHFGGKGQARLDISYDAGGTWQNFLAADSAESLGVREVPLPSSVMGGYDYRVRCSLGGKGTTLGDVSLRTVVQYNGDILPRLRLGDNAVHYSAAQDAPPARVTFRWIERTRSPLAVSLNAAESWCMGRDELHRLIAVQPGSSAEVVATLSRNDGKAVGGQARIEGLPEGWVATPGEAAFNAGKEPAQITFRVSSPAESSPSLYAAKIVLTPGEFGKQREVPFVLVCAPNAVILEAEGATEVNGMVLRKDVPFSSGGACLGATTGGVARYKFRVGKPGKHVLWLRAYTPSPYTPGRTRLDVRFDGSGPWNTTRPVQSELDHGLTMAEVGLDWQWNDTRPADLATGEHTVEVRAASGVVLDTLLLVPVENEGFSNSVTYLLTSRRFRPE